MQRLDEIDEAGLGRLVRAFYGRVRGDDLIGPVFEAAVEDWDEHLEKLTGFWSSVMLRSGRYGGNPMAAHAKVDRGAQPIRPEMFERWLALWTQTTDEMFAPAPAARLRETAERIGQSLSLALFFRPDSAPAA